MKPNVTTLRFSIDIAADRDHVRELMIGQNSYSEWTSAFTTGSHYVGSWDVGATIRFFDTNKDGMIGEIAENNGVDFISIRMLGYITKGVDDTTSEEILTWAPSYENYTYRSTTTGTQLIVDVEVSNEWIDFMSKTYPLALQRLKEICER